LPLQAAVLPRLLHKLHKLHWPLGAQYLISQPLLELLLVRQCKEEPLLLLLLLLQLEPPQRLLVAVNLMLPRLQVLLPLP
jgi:hypothetical protein